MGIGNDEARPQTSCGEQRSADARSWRVDRRLAEGDRLADEMHGENHSGVQHRDIPVIAFERRYGSAVGIRDGV